MLRTVPVKVFEMDQHGPLDFRLVARQGELLRELAVIPQVPDLDVAKHFHASAVRVIHQEQGGAIVSVQIAEADILPVAAEVREP